MLTKYDISFPMNYHDLPTANGFVIDVGEHKGQAYTALWQEASESNHPDYFWPTIFPDSYLMEFMRGISEEQDKAYKRGRAAGIALVQSGFGMVFGLAGKNYVQQIVTEMDKDNQR